MVTVDQWVPDPFQVTVCGTERGQTTPVLRVCRNYFLAPVDFQSLTHENLGYDCVPNDSHDSEPAVHAGTARVVVRETQQQRPAKSGSGQDDIYEGMTGESLPLFAAAASVR